jgi:hypothetical protein
MNLKLQYLKVILVFLAVLICFCFNVYAQSSTTIGNDTVVVTIKDENNNSVSLYLPESMNNDQCGRRIYGTRAGVIGMFETLYSEERRTESYEAAIRELCMQPEASQSYISPLEKSLKSAGIASEDVNLVLNLVKYGADSINKKYIKSGTLTADVHNRIAQVGRDLNAAQKSPAFAQACIAFENVKATAKLTETITGAFLLNSLSTDQAWIRLKEIERAVDSERKAQGKVDPALEEAIEQSEINLLAAQSKIGAFAVSVNDNLQEITDSAIGLGATLAEMSFKFSAPVAMWVAAPLMTYNTLRSVSDQWEMAQDGVSLATVTKMVEKHSQGREGVTDNITSYGQYAFYSQMEETFSAGGAKFHDFINIVGSANRDLSQYYKQRKQNTIIIAMKNGNSQEDETEASAKPEMITWERTYGENDHDMAYSIIQTSDDNYAVAGINSSKGSGGKDAWIIKLDEKGNMLWDKTFGGIDDDEANDLIQSKDNGYVISGYTKSKGSGNADVWIIKLDEKGNMLWDKTFGGKGHDSAYSLIQTFDGDYYVITGAITSKNDGKEDVWVVKLDNKGNKIWEKTFGGSSDDRAWAIVQTFDNGYTIGGYTYSKGAGESDFWIIKLDEKGNMLWDKTFGGKGYDVLKSLIQTDDDCYILVGFTNLKDTTRDAWIIKLDSKGNKIWDKTYRDEGVTTAIAQSIITTNDNAYIIAGKSFSRDAGGSNVLLMKLDKQGNKILDKTFGGEDYDDAFSLIQTTDGGYAVSGVTYPKGSVKQNAWVLKLNEQGNLE